MAASCRSLPSDLYFVEATDRFVSENGHVTEVERRAVAYGVTGKARQNLSSLYSPWKISEKGQVVSNTHLAASHRSLPSDLYFVEATDRFVSENGCVTDAARLAVIYEVAGKARHNSLSVYNRWGFLENGNQNTARRGSLPTLPKTYWSWPMPGEYSQNTAGCQEPLSLLLNTYWPWEIPARGTQKANRRRSLPIIPNTC